MYTKLQLADIKISKDIYEYYFNNRVLVRWEESSTYSVFYKQKNVHHRAKTDGHYILKLDGKNVKSLCDFMGRSPDYESFFLRRII